MCQHWKPDDRTCKSNLESDEKSDLEGWRRQGQVRSSLVRGEEPSTRHRIPEERQPHPREERVLSGSTATSTQRVTNRKRLRPEWLFFDTSGSPVTGDRRFLLFVRPLPAASPPIL